MADRDIAVKFTGDTRDLEQASEKAERSISGAGKGILGGLTPVIDPINLITSGFQMATAAVTDFVSAALEDDAAQQQLAFNLRQAAGASDEAVAGAEAYISTLSKTAAVADDELRPALGKLAVATGDTAKAQDLLALATDISAGTGKDLGTVSDALAKAQLGNTGALQRLGIATKDAAGETMSLDQILGKANEKFHGAAEAAGNTAAGGLNKAKISMDEFKESLGEKVLPILGELATAFSEKVMPVLEDIVKWAEEEWPKIMEQLGPGLEDLKTTFSDTMTEIKRFWDEWGDDIMRIAGVIFAGAVKDILIKLGDFLHGVESTFKFVNDTVKGFKDGWAELGRIFGETVDNFKKGWDTIKDAVGGGVNWVIDKVKEIGDKIGGAMAGVADLIKSPFVAAFNAIADLWNNTIGKLSFEFPWWIPEMGGKRIDVPDIPRFATFGALTIVMPPGTDGYDVARQLATFSTNVAPVTTAVAVR